MSSRLVVPLAALTFSASALVAQEPPSPSASASDSLPVLDISPRGAFLRALAIPGWGHAAIGAHTRGGFYFAAQSATAYTLIRSRQRVLDARERIAFRESFLRGRAAADGLTDPDQIDAVLDGDAELAELRRLEESRGDQQEDMVALGIFLLFLSGADAYVSAHLSRFPEPLVLEATPLGDGRFEVGLRLRIR